MADFNKGDSLMLHNSVLSKDVDAEDIKVFGQVWTIILDNGRYSKEHAEAQNTKFNCHSFCRALAHHVPEVKLVDGYVIGFEISVENDHKTLSMIRAEHSWLVLPKGAIMDPYPVGIMPFNPLLIPTRGDLKCFCGNMYMPDPAVKDIVLTPEMLKEIETNIAQMAKVLEWAKLQDK